MIEVTKLNGETINIDSDHIRDIACRPDTTLKFADGKTLVVKETHTEVIDRIISYRKKVFATNIGRKVTSKEICS